MPKKIDTNKDFEMQVPSRNKLMSFLRTILNKGEPLDMTTAGYGRRISYARGWQKNFKYYWDGDSKILTVTYTDGRDKPEEKEVKKPYYLVWVEGIETKEMIKSLTDTGFDYTTKMTEAMRVHPDDVVQLKRYMKRHGIADWVLDSGNTFIPTSYAPSGTLLKSKRIAF